LRELPTAPACKTCRRILLVRARTLGSQAPALLGHPASYYIVRALVRMGGILIVAVPLAVARYGHG